MEFSEDLNWDLLQFKYEVLGIPLEQLASEHTVSKAVLNYNAQSWVQSPLAKNREPLSLKDITSIEELITKLGSQTESEAKAFAILKQKFLGPKYVELETVLLHKAIQMASSIKENDPVGHRTLRALTTVLADLLQNNPLLNGNKNEDEDGSSNSREWKITVVKAEKSDKDGGTTGTGRPSSDFTDN